MKTKHIEQQAANYHGDGLFDIVFGAALLLVGALIAGGSALMPWGAVLPPLIVALMPALKRAITVPRLGGVEITETTHQRLQTAKLTILGMVTFLFLLGIAGFVALDWLAIQAPGWLWPNIMVLVGVVVIGILALLSWATHTRRYVAYILVAMIAALAGVAFGIALEWLLIVIGGFILTCGAVVLVRFINRHSIQRPTMA